MAHKEASSRLMDLIAPLSQPVALPISSEVLVQLRHSMDGLIATDWDDAQAGFYPISLLFDTPWLDWATHYPRVWLDMPAIWSRRSQGKVREIPTDSNESFYPQYYLQNFHHQTDGYLSDHSATLYDLQVDILFNGAVDPMRRRLLPPLVRGIGSFADRSPSQLRILDIATGTGRTLRQIRAALPNAQLVGLDLSKPYLRQANRSLSHLPGELPQLVQGNAEGTFFGSCTFQAITCVFLLHELPGDARQRVLAEAFRLLEPGGTLLLADSVQLLDSPHFRAVMENFRRFFHEPYYRDYMSDDIELRLRNAGFIPLSAESHFMTRVWAARKP